MDAYSGKSFCTNPAIAVQAAYFEPEAACSTTSSVVAWGSIMVSGYQGGGTPKRILMTVISEDNFPVRNWIDVPVALNQPVSMANLSLSSTGRNPAFVFQFEDVQGGNITDMTVAMKYDSRGPEM